MTLRCIYEEEHWIISLENIKNQRSMIHERNNTLNIYVVHHKRVIDNNLPPEFVVNSFKEKKQNTHCDLNQLFNYQNHVKQPNCGPFFPYIYDG